MKGICERCNCYSENLHEPLSNTTGPGLCPACIDKARGDKGENSCDHDFQFVTLDTKLCVKCGVSPSTEKEMVDHPDHYGGSRNTYEVIKVIEALGWGPDFCLGNCLKYLMRAGKKKKSKELEDLKKAKWYLERRIEQLESKSDVIHERNTVSIPFGDVPRPYCFGDPHEFDAKDDGTCVSECGHLDECHHEVSRQRLLAQSCTVAGLPACYATPGKPNMDAGICQRCIYAKGCGEHGKPGINSHSH